MGDANHVLQAGSSCTKQVPSLLLALKHLNKESYSSLYSFKATQCSAQSTCTFSIYKLIASSWVCAQVASLVVVNVQTSVSWAVGFAGMGTSQGIERLPGQGQYHSWARETMADWVWLPGRSAAGRVRAGAGHLPCGHAAVPARAAGRVCAHAHRAGALEVQPLAFNLYCVIPLSVWAFVAGRRCRCGAG